MKRSLHLKVWILLGYVLVCTAILLAEPVEPIADAAADEATGRGRAAQLNN